MRPRFWIALPVAIGVAAPLLAQRAAPSPASGRSPWPAGKRAAVSLSFDDARPSQLSEGLPVFAESNTKVTFFLTAGNIGTHADDWRRAAGAGHEIGNHTVNHPCSGNFAWSAPRALEDATLATMRTEMTEASQIIEQATGVRPVSFAYPCGQTFVGRGRQVTSYVPIVSELFVAGRGWLSEGPNDPVTGRSRTGVRLSDGRRGIRGAATRGGRCDRTRAMAGSGGTRYRRRSWAPGHESVDASSAAGLHPGSVSWCLGRYHRTRRRSRQARAGITEIHMKSVRSSVGRDGSRPSHSS